MILLIPVVIGLLAMLLMHFGNKLRNKYKDHHDYRAVKNGGKFELWCYQHESPISGVMAFSCVIFALILLSLFITHISYASLPAEYKAVTMTVVESRGTGYSDLERAAITHKIVDMNRELASLKYWNGSIWLGIFIPDRVAELEFIK